MAALRQSAAWRQPKSVPGLEGYTDTDTGSETRRLAWTLRAVALVAILEAFALAGVGFGFSAVVPLVRVVPMLLTIDHRGVQGIVKVEPFARGMKGFELMTESLVREYVMIVHTIIPSAAQMQDRWGHKLLHASSPEVFAEMRETYAEPAQALIDQGQARGVEIEGDPRRLDGSSDSFPLHYQVAFKTIDSQGTRTLASARWIATLGVDYVPEAVRYEDRYVNPLGFKVVSYHIARSGGGGAE